MKKVFIVTLFSIFLLFGCGEVFNKFDIDKKDIISIRLNNELIPSERYNEIDNALESINFSSKKINRSDDFAELTIKTNNESYLMKIYNNEIITFLDIDNKMYYASDKDTINSLFDIITNAKNKDDTDINLVDIEHIFEYNNNETNNIIVDLEPTLEAYKLTLNDDIDDISIYGTKYENDVLDKDNILYEKKDISKGKQLIIKTNTSEGVPKILIYITKDDITQIFTPMYNGITGETIFDIKTEKNNL